MRRARAASEAPSVEQRLAGLDWNEIARALWDSGWARVPGILRPDECAELIDLYPEERRFRSRVDMARFRFGVGEYKYFAHPLPPVVAAMRRHAYAPLSRVASEWEQALDGRRRFPAELEGLLAICAEHGQTRPTPLLLHYRAGGYNCLHQDVYGELVFPLQLTCLLSRPDQDFTGGEFVLVEQRPRAQSRAEVIPLDQGDAVIFATRERPARGARGYYRATLRHGVSRLHSGERYTLGVIFHDAK